MQNLANCDHADRPTGILFSEISQTEKDKCKYRQKTNICMISHICKNLRRKQIKKTETYIQRTNRWLPEEKGRWVKR